ncbi:hypothetical protein RHSIM_Rhsim01G0158200 [Rhododendron simsii]|uniref:HAT C-terminal dimerisation domain-containing protein n=1 Tax=Rhododendron simsii TaxID=118357 RepID=A0A834LUN6_RHOSS|nr:hypothetical protein RHSIM_Rhsim01G0158200 [Rhododendron simsii]
MNVGEATHRVISTRSSSGSVRSSESKKPRVLDHPMQGQQGLNLPSCSDTLREMDPENSHFDNERLHHDSNDDGPILPPGRESVGEAASNIAAASTPTGGTGGSQSTESVASESAFSAGNRVLDERRSRLAPDILDCLICLKDWEDARLGIQKCHPRDEFRDYFSDSDIDTD